MAKEIFEQEDTPTNVRIVINETKRPSGEHSKRYNNPLSDEIGVIIPNGATNNRDIVVSSEKSRGYCMGSQNAFQTTIYIV